MESERRRIDRSHEAARERVSRIIRGVEPGWGYLQGNKDHSTAAMKDNRLFLFLNGVNNDPNSIHQSTDVMHRICQKWHIRSDKYEYECTFLDRRVFQWKRVKHVIELVHAYQSDGLDVHLVGHSNGSDIICRVIKDKSVTLGGIHLIAGACDASFKKNNINQAIEDNRLDRVTVFCSDNDQALIKAGWKWIEWLKYIGLGYHQGSGCLGKVGPKYRSIKAHKITKVVRDNTLDHPDWYKGEQLEKTVRVIVGGVEQ